MILIDIAYPDAALSGDDKAALARSICSALLGTGTDSEDVPEETMRRARPMTQVAFSERTCWTTGDGPVPAGVTPPMWVTVTVPEAWRDEMARHVIGAIRAAVRRLDNDHGRQRSGTDLWINVVGVADGSIGRDGKASTADDVLDYLTEEFRATETTRELPEGFVLDPMCGMRVRLGRGAITLDHDGETIGFCAAACRDGYARRHGIPVPAA